MNEFTKEELRHLKACVSCTLLTGYVPSVQICDDLHEKLQSLIDNYDKCNHDSMDTNICYKCGHGINLCMI